MAQNGSHSGSWVGIEFQWSHWAKYMNSFWRIDDETFADFYDFLISHCKKTLKNSYF